jgi:hypothetical protein
MKLYSIFFINTIFVFNVYSQKNTEDKRLLFGLNYGQASQNKTPLNDQDYSYNNQYFKIQINYLLLNKNKISYELIIEPSLYLSEHQLLNKYFIQPHETPDYLSLREIFTQKRAFNEYVLNIGIIMRYKIINNFSSYVLGSIGPMFSDEDTERLRKGFAFSDIFGLGFSYERKKVVFDLRLTVRHNSNADLYLPNGGHNSIGVESGISFRLR